jgi:hypothetical protein
VLPSYSVKVEVPKIAAIPSLTFQTKVIAAYTFGESVEGVAVVTFLKSDYSYYYYPTRKVLFVKTVNISSAAEAFDVNIKDDLKIYYAESVNVEVKFTEAFTRKVVETSAAIQFVWYAYEMLLTGSEVLVPNQPYNLKVSLRKVGTGVPVSQSQ